MRTTTPAFAGFKFAFSAVGAPRHHGGHELVGSYKTSFSVPAGDDWTALALPLAAFSADWSDFTGDCATKDPDGYQHTCCSDETPEVCPDAERLAAITGFSVWAEGAEGDFNLEIQSVVAATL